MCVCCVCLLVCFKAGSPTAPGAHWVGWPASLSFVSTSSWLGWESFWPGSKCSVSCLCSALLPSPLHWPFCFQKKAVNIWFFFRFLRLNQIEWFFFFLFTFCNFFIFFFLEARSHVTQNDLKPETFRAIYAVALVFFEKSVCPLLATL